jgi:hypothetical protein
MRVIHTYHMSFKGGLKRLFPQVWFHGSSRLAAFLFCHVAVVIALQDSLTKRAEMTGNIVLSHNIPKNVI